MIADFFVQTLENKNKRITKGFLPKLLCTSLLSDKCNLLNSICVGSL